MMISRPYNYVGYFSTSFVNVILSFKFNAISCFIKERLFFDYPAVLCKGRGNIELDVLMENSTVQNLSSVSVSCTGGYLFGFGIISIFKNT